MWLKPHRIFRPINASLREQNNSLYEHLKNNERNEIVIDFVLRNCKPDFRQIQTNSQDRNSWKTTYLDVSKQGKTKQNLHESNTYKHTSQSKQNTQIADRAWSRLKGMSRKDLINIQTTDVRHRIPKICSAALKMMTVDREVILSKLCCSKDLKSSAVRFQRYIYGYMFLCCESPLST